MKRFLEDVRGQFEPVTLLIYVLIIIVILVVLLKVADRV